MLRNTTRFLIITSLIGGLQMFEEPKLLFSGWASLGNGQTGGPGHTALTTVWKFLMMHLVRIPDWVWFRYGLYTVYHNYAVFCSWL